MDISFGPVKWAETLANRGLDFADSWLVSEGRTVTRQDMRREYGEDRFLTSGYLAGRCVVPVWTPRHGTRRIISMRHAHDHEEAAWFGALIDPDDAPELTAEMLADAELFEGNRFIRRGPGRPRSDSPKEQISVRLDRDVLAKLREAGPGWQSQINALLRDALRVGNESPQAKPTRPQRQDA